ncbi:hypothetical protein Tco_0688460 [Tanacetum coccineum]
MSGTHLVAGDYRWGKNSLRSFPSEHSSAKSRWGYLAQRHVAGERPDNSPGKGAIVVVISQLEKMTGYLLDFGHRCTTMTLMRSERRYWLVSKNFVDEELDGAKL